MDATNLKPGNEQYETYTSRIGRRPKKLVQYDFRADNGKLFSCVKTNLEKCREAKEAWLKNQG